MCLFRNEIKIKLMKNKLTLAHIIKVKVKVFNYIEQVFPQSSTKDSELYWVDSPKLPKRK